MCLLLPAPSAVTPHLDVLGRRSWEPGQHQTSQADGALGARDCNQHLACGTREIGYGNVGDGSRVLPCTQHVERRVDHIAPPRLDLQVDEAEEMALVGPENIDESFF